MLIIFLILSENEKDMVDQIFSKHHVKLYNISFKILRSEKDAEDALAQTFLKIIDNIERIKEITCHEILPFCATVVRNSSLDIQRQNSKTILVESFEEWKDFSVDAAENTFFKNHDRERLLRLIKKLSSEERYLLELRLIEDMSYKDIGAIMNITESTARKRLQRALEKLQKLYLEEEYVNV